MTQTIHDRLQQLQVQRQEVGKTDSAHDIHGPGAQARPKGGAKSRRAPATPDSPREVHGDGVDKASPEKAAAKAAAPKVPALPLSTRGKLVAARTIVESTQARLKSQLDTARRFARHADDQLEGQDELLRGLAGELAGGPEAYRLSGGAEGVAGRLRSQFEAPVAGLARRLEVAENHLRQLDGLLGLKDEELHDLKGTRSSLDWRLSGLQRNMARNQEVMVWHDMGRPNPETFFRDPADARMALSSNVSQAQVTRAVFEDRQEYVRLNRALEAIDGLKTIVDL